MKRRERKYFLLPQKLKTICHPSADLKRSVAEG
jgi:hypothetical protein